MDEENINNYQKDKNVFVNISQNLGDYLETNSLLSHLLFFAFISSDLTENQSSIRSSSFFFEFWGSKKKKSSMWLEILCGLVFFRFFRRFFYDEDEDLLNNDSSDSSAIFYVATRIEKIYGGKEYVGLRIPDADSNSRQNIDMVLVTKGTVMVVSVWNFTGSVDIDNDGSWVSTGEKRHKKEKLPSLVEETKRRVAILESYLEQRGVILPEGYLIGRVVLPNPNCRVTYAIDCLPEVISFDKWSELKPEPKAGFSNWFKDAFRGGKSDTQEAMHQKLHFSLSTAPMWDRLTGSSLEILNGRQSTNQQLKMGTLMNTWVKFQRFHGLCQRFLLHQRPLDSTGRRKSRTTYQLMIRYLCLTFVVWKVTVGIIYIQETPKAKGMFNMLVM